MPHETVVARRPVIELRPNQAKASTMDEIVAQFTRGLWLSLYVTLAHSTCKLR